MARPQIPFGIIIFGVLNILFGIFWVFMITLGLLSIFFIPTENFTLDSITRFIFLFLVFSTQIVMGIGLIKLKRLAWTLFLTLVLLSTILVFFEFPWPYLLIITNLITCLYLISGSVRKAFGFKQTIEHADDLFNKGKLSGAKEIYDHIIEYSDTDNLLGKAYFGLGNIALQEPDKASAFENYKKAREYSHPLNEDAILFVSNYYVEQGSKTEAAIEIYLESIKYIDPKMADESAKKIYTLLKSICQISEQDSTSMQKKAMEYNHSVIDANSSIGWAHYYLGIGYLHKGDTDNAIDHLEKAHKLEPQHELTCYYIGRTYFEINETEKALLAFKHSLELGCDNKDVLFQIARLLLTQENVAKEHIQEAIGYLKDVIELNSKSEYYYYLGLAYSLFDEHRNAKKNLEQAIEIDGDYIDAYRLIARICFEHDEFEEAEPYLRKILSMDEKDKEACLLLGYLLYELEQFEEAVVELEPVAKNDKRGLYSLARSCLKTDRFDKAVDYFAHFNNRFGEDVNTHYYMGCAYANLSRYDDAMQSLNRSLDLEKQSKTYLQRGNVFLIQDQLDNAYADYKESLSHDPDNVNVIYAIGNYWYQAGNDEQAMSSFNRAIELDPKQVHAHTGKGLIHEKHKDFTHAMHEYEFATQEECRCALPYKRLGILYHDQQDYSKSLENLLKAQQYGNENDALRYYLGSAFVHNGQFKKGLDIWKELYELYPEDKRLEVNIYKSHYCFGHQCIQEQKYLEAISEWEEYIKKYNEDEMTRSHLADIYFREFINSRDENKLRKAIELNDDDRYRYYASLCDITNGNCERGISVLEQLSQNDQNSRLKYHLSLAMLRQEEHDKAIEILNEIVSANNSEYSWHASTVIANEFIKNEDFSEAKKILKSALEKGGYANAD